MSEVVNPDKRTADPYTPEQVELLRKYLKEQTVFIVDTASASRRRLAATIVGLGATTSKITLHGQYEEAEADMKARAPKVVICDYVLGRRSGLELLQVQRQSHPEGGDCLFILVTGNSSQSAVARAAEEDVDSFILKPYTINSLTETLVASAVSKLFPSPYRKAIEDGKVLLFSGKIHEAMEVFERAMGMNTSPALACFYYGQAEYMLRALNDAKGSYMKGLNFNKIHYKCLVGLFEIFMAEKMYKEAYEVIRRVQKYFPANPKRLASVIRLAVLNERYADIESLYSVFKDMEYRDDEIVRYMCAGLVVSAQYSFKQQNNEKALELLNHAAVSAAGQVSFLRRIIEILAEQGQVEKMQDFLNRFPADVQKGADFLLSRFLFLNMTAQPGIAIQFGQTLIKDGVRSPLLYESLIKRYMEYKKKDMAEDLLQDGLKRWPEESSRFDSLRGIYQLK